MIFLSRAVAFPLFFICLGAAQIFSASFSLAAEKIDINTATKEELEKLIGVGPVIAQRIIDARPFSSVDDLIRVNRIGEKTLQKIIEQGLAWVEANQSFQLKPEPQPQAESEKPVVDDSRQQTYPSSIVINEILPYPEGPDAEDEWIEVFNQNNFEADLSGWQISDTSGKTYTLPAGTKIPAQGFLVLPRPTTKITLNNDEDGLSLVQPNGNILDSVKYQKAPQGQSYNRTESGWTWSSTLTPGSANIIPAPSPKIKDEEKNKEEPQKELAAVSESFRQIQEKQISKPLFTFLVALGLAILSGAIIFILKKKIKDIDLSKKLE